MRIVRRVGREESHARLEAGTAEVQALEAPVNLAMDPGQWVFAITVIVVAGALLALSKYYERRR